MSVKALETPRHTMSLAAGAPAKLNLTLDVLGRRGDGFHELRSIVIGVGFGDEVRCSIIPGDQPEIVCYAPALANAENLAVRAVRCLADHTGRQAGIRVDLTKRIPVAAGLGGGSSDAATTFHLCNTLWQTELADDDLARLGSKLGSDIPLFFSLPAVEMSGRGEIVRPIELAWAGWVVLVMTDALVSTRDVYAAWDPQDGADDADADADQIVGCRTADELMPLLRNHLERAVFRVCPLVEGVSASLDELFIGSWRVAGAGSVLFRLFDQQQQAREVAARIDSAEWGVCTQVARAPMGNNP